jgi:hypothetical protein
LDGTVPFVLLLAVVTAPTAMAVTVSSTKPTRGSLPAPNAQEITVAAMLASRRRTSGFPDCDGRQNFSEGT